MSTVTYHGRREDDGTCVVEIRGGRVPVRKLPLRLDLANHSPTGFEWSYGGSGPAQLALALLAHATGNDALAVRQHQKFKWKVIANLDRNAEWTMTRERIRAISQQISETRSLASQEGRW